MCEAGVALGNCCCCVPGTKLIVLHSPMGPQGPHRTLRSCPLLAARAVLLREVLQVAHCKYCQFSLVTGFCLLFGLAGAVRKKEALAFTCFSSSDRLPFLHTPCSWGGTAKERYKLQEANATSSRYFCRSQRKPLIVGGGITFDHIFYRNWYGPLVEQLRNELGSRQWKVSQRNTASAIEI